MLVCSWVNWAQSRLTSPLGSSSSVEVAFSRDTNFLSGLMLTAIMKVGLVLYYSKDIKVSMALEMVSIF